LNVRVIAATNQDVRSAVAQGLFRDDLYYRINVFDISLPALRERGRDVLLLAHHFMKELSLTHCRPYPQLTVGASEALLSYHWPGNVRELRNVLERALVECDGPSIDAEHLSLTVRGDMPSLRSTDLRVLEQQAITQALREVAGNKARAAQKLGISRTQLYSRLNKYGLHRE